METSKITPLSADEIIAEVEKKGGRRLSNNVRIAIRILSEEALSRKKLAERLGKEPGYDCRGVGSRQIESRAGVLRYHGILGRQDGTYFIKRSKTDPCFQNNCLRPPISPRNQGRSLRSILYEILKQKPMPVGRLVLKAACHPDYSISFGKSKDLKRIINSVLNSGRNKNFFERDGSRAKYANWRVKNGSEPPAWKARQRPYPRRDALYRLMRTKGIIKGWSYHDLFEEWRGSKSGYASLKVATAALNHIFYRDKAEHFEQCPRDDSLRWRAKWLGPLKVPDCPSDFFDLAGRILDDLMVPQNFEDLLKAIRRYSYLFGYQTNELPLLFLRNGVARAVAGTKYAGLVL
ncbi:MAG: hypothetical protein AAB791_03670 [Patescibacteria group bacterium]